MSKQLADRNAECYLPEIATSKEHNQIGNWRATYANYQTRMTFPSCLLQTLWLMKMKWQDMDWSGIKDQKKTPDTPLHMAWTWETNVTCCVLFCHLIVDTSKCKVQGYNLEQGRWDEECHISIAKKVKGWFLLYVLSSISIYLKNKTSFNQFFTIRKFYYDTPTPVTNTWCFYHVDYVLENEDK